jgi:HNH endonuclease
MERAIGRLLTKEEVVHHRNHDRQDNSISNLQLFPTIYAHSSYHAEDKKVKVGEWTCPNPECKSRYIRKNGFNQQGKQLQRCTDCLERFTANYQKDEIRRRGIICPRCHDN